LQKFAIRAIDIMSHHQIRYKEQIREQGYRLTPQRQIIMDALCGINDHATVNEVYERVQAQMPSIDRATVYRTLHFFRELCLVVATEMDGEMRYEVAGTTPHHHLICRICGAEQELSDKHLRDLVEHLQQEHGFTAEINHLVIPGVCQKCAEPRKDGEQ
jgi:Fur family ferric uptake transcriptional regulator